MTPADLDADADELRLADLVAQVRREADELATLLPVAVGAQWTAAPVARPREDTAERSKHERSDPTSDVALDTDRLQLRNHLLHTERVIRAVAAALQDARQELKRGLAAWTGADR
ncbi:hypothetical protein [Micromonospora sp. NPDC047730]|uniref:DUF7169 domain-containing protein n=1 Tax=Micromonospora sp. NPDC047730 TaxID=3364253 RepID=UPI003713DEB0